VISALDIRERATEWGLSPDVVEKDYVLGWILAGIGADPVLGTRFVFKGGTCLKKCHFETYRFSADLDFTLSEGAPSDAKALTAAFARVARFVEDAAGLELPADRFRWEVYANTRGRPAIEGRIYYRGPLARPAGNMPRIKLDLTADEISVRPTMLLPIAHPYPDQPAMGDARVRSYSYDELFGEKLRALVERTSPRDLYDVVNMLRYDPARPASSTVADAFRTKCRFKGFEAALSADGLLPPERREDLVVDWGPMLGHQLPALPPVANYVSAIREVAEWLSGAPIAALASLPMGPDDSGWTAPRTIDVWQAGFSAELVRFAGRNRLVIDLGYDGTTRLVEPYSYRRTEMGGLLLYGWNVASGGIRAYRADRIDGVRVTDEPFEPRYRVEF